jgi:hypothetical protein
MLQTTTKAAFVHRDAAGDTLAMRQSVAAAAFIAIRKLRIERST